MADLALCASTTCPVRLRCRRNEACPTAYHWHSTRQSVAHWHPEAGAGCSGFIDAGSRDWIKGAATSAAMLGTFALLMIPGFWLRHGYPIWSAF